MWPREARHGKVTVSKYIPTDADKIPANVRWDVPRHNQGQIVEVAYADAHPGRDEACAGSKYRRVSDRSDLSITYAVLAG